MPVEAAKGAWDSAIQYGVVGIIAFFAVCACAYLVSRSEKKCDEQHKALSKVLENKDEIIASKDQKMQAVYEGVCATSTTAMYQLTVAVNRLTEKLDK